MQPKATQPSPLLDVGMGFISELGRPITAEQGLRIREILVRYLARTMSFQACVSVLIPLLGTAQPIEKLEAILRTPDVPLPYANAALAQRVSQDSRAKSRPWTNYEDQRLLAGIHRYGLDNWQLIALFVGNGRTKSQCSQRWSRGLDPKICKEQWSPEQDDRLIDLVALYGEKSWTRVAMDLGNRCDVQCRYRYRQLQKEPGFHAKHSDSLEKVKGIVVPPQPKMTAKRRMKFPEQAAAMTTSYAQIPPAMMAPMTMNMMVQQQMHMMGMSQPNIFMGISTAAAPFFQQPINPGCPPPPRPQEKPGPKPPDAPTGKTEEEPAEKAPHQFNLFSLDSQVPGQGPNMDWANTFSVSPSGSTFGISPMNSFKF
jgi:hypothetical protein